MLGHVNLHQLVFCPAVAPRIHATLCQTSALSSLAWEPETHFTGSRKYIPWRLITMNNAEIK